MESQPVATAFSRKSISIPLLSAGHITPEQRWTQTINDNVAERQFYGLSHKHRLKALLKDFTPSRDPKKPDTAPAYYRAILQNLFFGTLNMPPERRAFR